MSKEYIEFRDGGYWIKESRISLDSLVYAFQRGASPESIQQSFPLLTLEEVYGAITYYLAHQAEIDAYLKELSRLERKPSSVVMPSFVTEDAPAEEPAVEARR